jgi:hypothetical protein
MSSSWFRFVPDEGPSTSFNADSVLDAQRFAARYFHSVPGAIFGPLEITWSDTELDDMSERELAQKGWDCLTCLTREPAFCRLWRLIVN